MQTKTADAGKVSGHVTFKGMPVPAAEVTLVTLGEAKPRVFTTTAHPDGTYQFKESLPAGQYVVIVTGKGLPAKFQTTTTSGLRFEVKPGANSFVINLQ